MAAHHRLVPAAFGISIMCILIGLEHGLHTKGFEGHVATLKVDLVAVENVVRQTVRYFIRRANLLTCRGLLL